MAHFINANGSRISNSIQPSRLGAPITIGVWGAAGLTVGPNDRSVATIKALGPDKANNFWYQLTGLRTGQVMVEAKMGAAVWDFFQLAVKDAGSAGALAAVEPNADGRYTSHPKEVKTVATRTTAASLLSLLTALQELTNQGKRSLIAQHMHETGGGKSCYNWNLGNARPKSQDEPHMYLRNVGEYLSPSMAARALEAGREDGTARGPTSEEKKRWTPRAGLVVVIFNPPSEGARFKAFNSLSEGGQGLIAKYRHVAASQPDFFPALNAGDLDKVAEILLRARYYTGSKDIYASRMKVWDAVIGRELGPVTG